MKSSVLAISIAILLCACTPPASTDAADADATASDTPAMTNPAKVPTDASVAPDPATTGATEAPADAAPGAPMPNPDGDKAVNDAIDSNLGDHTKYQAVIRQFQTAVAANDAATVASLVNYPIGVDIKGKNTVIKDEKTFVAEYDQFMTPDISKAIIDTKYSDLMVNYKGVMFGRGEAWIKGICKDEKCNAFDVKVVTIQSGPN